MREDRRRSQSLAKSLRTRLTEAETILWSKLREWRQQGTVFRRQHPIGPYIADFACIKAKLVVELDGSPHGETQHHIHDQRRDAYMAARGWRVVRISNDKVYTELGKVLEMLSDALPPPSPVGATSPAISKPCGGEVGSPRGRKE